MFNGIVLSLICLCVIGTLCLLEENIGKGVWTITNIQKCPDEETYPMQYELKRRKLNRTHDGFTYKMDLQETVTAESHGVYLDVCKLVDGGCKTQIIINETSVCEFFDKHAKESFSKGLLMSGREPDCPIEKGNILIENYVMDYESLPAQGMPGEYIATIYLTKDGVNKNCMKAKLDFNMMK